MSMDHEEAKRENETWRRERLERCRDPNGWLTLAGLCWLEEGDNSFGAASDNAVIFEVTSAPARLGTVVLNSKNDLIKAAFHPIAGVEVRHQGNVITAPLDLLHDEQPGGPTTLTYGSLSWFLVLRSGRYALRLKDAESAVLKNFTGIDMYPLDLKWRIEAEWVAHEPPKVLTMPNALGVMEEQQSPGQVKFTVDGKTYLLDVTGNPEVKAFIIFADATTNKTTYGGGRYLYASGPVKDGKVVIDFNQAYNPPCVFTDFATCAYAHSENRLTTLAIEAGEKKFKGGPHK